MGHGAIGCQRGFQAADVVAVAVEAGGLVKAAREWCACGFEGKHRHSPVQVYY
jgi:Na+-translocating ferredoxin:NAD+ oxidoreductase RNF subunit RnfB